MAELAAKPISELKSVGAGKRAENFAKFGITNLVELLTHYPRRWIDRTREAPIADAAEGVASHREKRAPEFRGPTGD